MLIHYLQLISQISKTVFISKPNFSWPCLGYDRYIVTRNSIMHIFGVAEHSKHGKYIQIIKNIQQYFEASVRHSKKNKPVWYRYQLKCIEYVRLSFMNRIKKLLHLFSICFQTVSDKYKQCYFWLRGLNCALSQEYHWKSYTEYK